MKSSSHLMPQDAKAIDPATLTALTPEVVCHHEQYVMFR